MTSAEKGEFRDAFIKPLAYLDVYETNVQEALKDSFHAFAPAGKASVPCEVMELVDSQRNLKLGYDSSPFR